jgi:short-subunit dehydrogenase
VCPRVDIKSTFSTKWALITGASAGLGHHISVRLASQGINVIGVGRNTAGLDSTKSAVVSKGAEFVPVVADLYRPDSIGTIMGAVGDRDIGVLVLNAGLGIVGPVSDVTDAFVTDFFFLMMTSYALLAREFLARGRRPAVIQMTASLAGESTGPWATLYCGVKAYVSRLAKHLAIECGPDVKVTAMHPGMFRQSKFFRDDMAAVQGFADRLPLVPTADEVADGVERTIGRADLVWHAWHNPLAVSFQWMVVEPGMVLTAKAILAVGCWIAGKKR